MIGASGPGLVWHARRVRVPCCRLHPPLQQPLKKLQPQIVECEEDSDIALTTELKMQRGVLPTLPSAPSVSASSGSSDGGSSRWLLPVAASVGAAAGTAACLAGFLLRRRRHAARSLRTAPTAAAATPPAGASAPAEQSPLTPRTTRLHRMESGDHQLLPALDAALSVPSPAGSSRPFSRGASRAGSAGLERALSAEGWHADALFRSRRAVGWQGHWWLARCRACLHKNAVGASLAAHGAAPYVHPTPRCPLFCASGLD